MGCTLRRTPRHPHTASLLSMLWGSFYHGNSGPSLPLRSPSQCRAAQGAEIGRTASPQCFFPGLGSCPLATASFSRSYQRVPSQPAHELCPWVRPCSGSPTCCPLQQSLCLYSGMAGLPSLCTKRTNADNLSAELGQGGKPSVRRPALWARRPPNHCVD